MCPPTQRPRERKWCRKSIKEKRNPETGERKQNERTQKSGRYSMKTQRRERKSAYIENESIRADPYIAERKRKTVVP